MVRTILSVATAALLSSAGIVAANDGFEEIVSDLVNATTTPTGVVLPSVCIGPFMVPKTMYTIEPIVGNETDVRILSKPAGLVEPGFDEDDGKIYLKFNIDVIDDANDAGVIIQFPADQLESVSACCVQSVQIKPGFTNFQTLSASTSAVVNAEFDVEQENNMSFDVRSAATVNVKVTGTAENVGGTTKIGVVAVNRAKANFQGNITAIICADESTCKIAGSIQDVKQSSADAGSTLEAESCRGVTVTTESVCESKTADVSVDTNQGTVISGVKEECFQGGDLDGMGRGTDSPTESPAPTISKAPTVSPTASPPTDAPVAPTDAPTASGARRGAVLSAVLSGAVFLLLLGQ